MTKSVNIMAAFAAALCVGLSFAANSATARESSAPSVSELARANTAAATAQARVGASRADSRALVSAVRSNNAAAAKAVLLRDGFTAKQLAGAKIVLTDNTAGPGGGHGGEASKTKVTIKASCCPLEIEIIISF